MLSISLFIIITSVNISSDSITDTYGNLIFPIEINVIHWAIQQTLSVICLVASTIRISMLAVPVRVKADLLANIDSDTRNGR